MKQYDLDEFRIFVQNEWEKKITKYKASPTKPVDMHIAYDRLNAILELIHQFKAIKEDPKLLKEHYETS